LVKKSVGFLLESLPSPNKSGATPYWAVLIVGVTIDGLVLIGDVKTTWSFSAFTVLIYYALTSLAALKLPRERRLYPRWVAGLGLVVCLFLAFWVERETSLLPNLIGHAESSLVSGPQMLVYLYSFCEAAPYPHFKKSIRAAHTPTTIVFSP
jgi:hypothetical protein